MTDSESVIWCEGEDAEMIAAIREAQSTFPEFLKALELDTHRTLPVIEATIIKAFFPKTDDPKKGEHMFVTDLIVTKDGMRGLLSNEPLVVDYVKEGDTVVIPASRVSDWIYVISGKGRGGFTLRVIAQQMSSEDFQEAAKEPPFLWFKED